MSARLIKHAVALHTLVALDQIFALVRQVAVQADDAAALESTARALRETIAAAEPPFALQFLPHVVLRDRVPLPLTLEGYRRAQQCIGALQRLGANELVVEQVPPLSALIDLAETLFHATNNHRGERSHTFGGLHLRMRAQAQNDGSPASEALLDRWVGEQVALTCAQAERVLAYVSTHGSWPWGEGRALAWRLERCMAASVSVTGRAIELAPLAWTPSRRALSCAFAVGAVLARLQVSPLAQRAATHAALALATCGLREQDGLPFAVAAGSALNVLLAPDAELATDAHRLRMCALMRFAAHADAAAAPLAPLLHVAYELERRRCPADLPLRLSRLDLQAWLAGALGNEVHAAWGRALLGLLGVIPIGSHVLAEGRLGVVVATGERGDPLRPRVLLGGAVAAVTQPVALYSPLGMSPWAK